MKYAATGPNQWVTGPRYWDEDWLKDHFRRRDCGTKQFDDRECSFWSQDLSRDVAFLENYTVSYNKSIRRLKMGRSSARSSRPIEACIIEGVLLCMEMLLGVARWGGIPKRRMG